MSTEIIKIQACAVGDSGVGKTSILKAMSTNSPVKESEEAATVGGTFRTIKREYEGKPVEIRMTDTGGEERFRSIAKTFYRKAKFALLVFDITDNVTFESLQYWIDEAQENVPDIKIIVVGNKTDKENERQVSVEKAMEFAKNNNCLFCQTSAISFDGINELADRIVDLQMKSGEQEEQVTKNDNIQLVDLVESSQNDNQGFCC